MIAFASMLIPAAIEAGMVVPQDTSDIEDWATSDKYSDPKYMKLRVFLGMQLAQPMPSPDAHWENAKVIASIPDDKLKTMTVGDVFKLGFAVGRSY